MSKTRVYELAKEFGIENKEFIAKLKTLGIAVKSHSSTLEDSEVERVRREFAAKGEKEVVEKRVKSTVIRRRAVRLPEEAAEAEEAAAPEAPAEPAEKVGKVEEDTVICREPEVLVDVVGGVACVGSGVGAEVTVTNLSSEAADLVVNCMVDGVAQPEQTFPNRVFFGDTHLHTSYSADAGMVGNTLGPEEVYRFAKGEVVKSSTGINARLARPLDFLVVADHAENLGLAPMLASKDPALMATEFGRELRKRVDAGDLPGAWNYWSKTKAGGKDPLAASQDVYRAAWTSITELADRHNEPGRFTPLIGFEWTAAWDRNNLHRNVIFRGGKKNADTVIPFSAFDSNDPEDLWRWMASHSPRRLLCIGRKARAPLYRDVDLYQKKLVREILTLNLKFGHHLPGIETG